MVETGLSRPNSYLISRVGIAHHISFPWLFLILRQNLVGADTEAELGWGTMSVMDECKEGIQGATARTNRSLALVTVINLQ